ncbi:hypothetical protein C9J98_14895 [Stenotrophomonas panacihumi]|nr:hypothetical protein C9J98_14895 [Stenotrophomonas panacihumi]
MMGAWLALAAIPTMAATPRCDLPEELGMREIDELLSRRAVDLVRRAADPMDRLTGLVAPSAPFDLGGGDVGRPLGKGTRGARELVRLMHADSYRYLGWGYMNTPRDGCARYEINVEFTDSSTQTLSLMTFQFEAGVIVEAKGWQRSFQSGPLQISR